jgi:hypothetical protein
LFKKRETAFKASSKYVSTSGDLGITERKVQGPMNTQKKMKKNRNKIRCQAGHGPTGNSEILMQIVCKINIEEKMRRAIILK